MANKQIKDFELMVLDENDSLIKQSISGSTGRTTVADLRTKLDAYTKSEVDNAIQAAIQNTWNGEY